MQNQKSIKIWISLGAAAIVFGAGMFAGVVFQLKSEQLGSGKSVDITRVINLYSRSRSPEVDFSQFWTVWDLVKSKYVNQPVDDTKLFYGAMTGMVQGLGDPHSEYFPPKEAEDFAKDMAGELEGIGAEIGIKDNTVTVIAPLPKSPAEKAGIKTGDKIFKIDKEDTQGMTLNSAISRIRGKEGTTVALIVLHKGASEVAVVKVTRAKISIPTVKLEMKDKNIAYLNIAYFNQGTSDEFDRAVSSLVVKQPKGIILDLRSDPGGYLDSAIHVGSEWIKTGVIVSEKFKDGSEVKHDTEGEHRLAGIPTVVLVDGGSASGAEIVAGALQDFKAGTLVGEKTYGKGSVQDFQALPDGSAIKITIAKWFTPKGRGIDGEGILPDITLENMIEKKESVNPKDTPDYIDHGVEKAIQILTGSKS